MLNMLGPRTDPRQNNNILNKIIALFILKPCFLCIRYKYKNFTASLDNPQA